MNKPSKRVLIKSALIVDPNSEFNKQTKDILVDRGTILRIADAVEDADADAISIPAGACCISPGWFDLYSNFGEPGYETREDLETGTEAALRGGFTGVCVMPDTSPALHSKTEIEFIVNKAARQKIEIIPIGAISKNREGLEMAELYDMWLSGARAFSEGSKPLADSGLLLRALQYASDFGALVMSYPEDKSLSGSAQVHEGKSSLLLGMKGIPSIAEELMVARDLMLAEYTGCRIHFSTISTADSAMLIRNARRKGIQVSASVAAHHLVLDDTSLSGFDSNYKVKPPLRTLKDIEALKQALLDGTIDAVCTQHTPLDIELKQVEFEMAAYGIIGLETCYSLLNMALGKISEKERIVELLALAPRRILGLDLPSIKEGGSANFTLYDPEQEYTFSQSDIGSRSSNTPWLGKILKGRILGVYSKGFFYRN